MKIKNIIDQVVNFKSRWNDLNQFKSTFSPKKRQYGCDKLLRDILDVEKPGNQCVSLDLGSGPFPQNVFCATNLIGVDIRENSDNKVVYCDFSAEKLPFEDLSFDYVTAHHVLEHIPRVVRNDGRTVFPLIELFNEVFRVLKNGGIFFGIQPCYPFREAFMDPTHVNIMTEDTVKVYFCEQAWARIYGYNGSFEMLKDGWIGSQYFFVVRKSHDRPILNLKFMHQ